VHCLVENRQLLGELEGIDLLLQQLSVSDDFIYVEFLSGIITVIVSSDCVSISVSCTLV